MTNITLAWAPASASLSVISNDESYLTLPGAYQVQGRSGARHKLSMVWKLAGIEGRALRAQLGLLNGQRNRLLVSLSLLQYIRGGAPAGSVAVVHGAHLAGATSLTLRGLTAATNNILSAGDYLTVGSSGQLVQATSQLNANGSPNTRGTLTIWPPLTKNRADGTTVQLATPTGLFIMTNDFGFNMEPMPSESFWYSELMAEFVEDVLA